MSIEEIDKFYKYLEERIDNDNKVLNLGVISDVEKRDSLIALYSNEEGYIEYRTIFTFHNEETQTRRNYFLNRSTLRQDGYINFNNYFYRDIDTTRPRNMNFFQFAEKGIHPLKSFPGYVVIDKDIAVYETIYRECFIDNIQIMYKQIGYLEAGTVIRIDSILPNGTSLIVGIPRKQGFIKATDIDLINQLQKNVTYRIINEKLYRFIEDQQIEIKYYDHHSGLTENGYRYIRNDLSNTSLDRFYFWEKAGDYLFDEDGYFLRVVDFGPSWSGK